MKLLYGFIFLFLSLVAGSQKLIKGIVVEEEKNAPLSNVSVFLNTTAIGTITTTHGGFSLSIPNGSLSWWFQLAGTKHMPNL